MTFYNAVSILDNYLLRIADRQQQAPCHESLAISCYLIAAKLNHAGVNGLNVFQSIRGDISPENIIEMELRILLELEFEL